MKMLEKKGNVHRLIGAFVAIIVIGSTSCKMRRPTYSGRICYYDSITYGPDLIYQDSATLKSFLSGEVKSTYVLPPSIDCIWPTDSMCFFVSENLAKELVLATYVLRNSKFVLQKEKPLQIVNAKNSSVSLCYQKGINALDLNYSIGSQQELSRDSIGFIRFDIGKGYDILVQKKFRNFSEYQEFIIELNNRASPFLAQNKKDAGFYYPQHNASVAFRNDTMIVKNFNDNTLKQYVAPNLPDHRAVLLPDLSGIWLCAYVGTWVKGPKEYFYDFQEQELYEKRYFFQKLALSNFTWY